MTNDAYSNELKALRNAHLLYDSPFLLFKVIHVSAVSMHWLSEHASDTQQMCLVVFVQSLVHNYNTIRLLLSV